MTRSIVVIVHADLIYQSDHITAQTHLLGRFVRELKTDDMQARVARSTVSAYHRKLP